ncbi:MAG: hypothetical protein ACJAZQ_002917 [Cognaticolwellia sp.]|jgi:hypothetical protein
MLQAALLFRVDTKKQTFDVSRCSGPATDKNNDLN